jgi:hypothetical protein
MLPRTAEGSTYSEYCPLTLFVSRTVDKSLQKLWTILDTTRHPRLAHKEKGHTYDDKFAEADFLVNTYGSWACETRLFFCRQVERRILGKHTAPVSTNEPKQRPWLLGEITKEVDAEIFYPALPPRAKGSILSMWGLNIENRFC